MIIEDYDRYSNILARLDKLEEYDKYVNLTIPDHSTEAGDEFIRQGLVSLYSFCEGRDAPALEYVIRLVSTPDQWTEFYEANDLKNVYAIGE